MERLKKINQHYIGSFQISDYHITHSQLLLRCSNTVNHINVNLDLKFDMVMYFELPRTLNDIYITNGNDEDWVYIKKRYNEEVYNTPPHDFQQLFKILSEERVYYILASSCLIDTNSLPPLQSSIDSPR